MRARRSPDRIGASSIDGAWAFLAVLLPVAVVMRDRMHVVDLAYQIRAGQEFLATGTIADTETWTFTVAGTPWLNQQWGAEAILALLYRGGWGVLALSRGILVGMTMAFIFLACRGRGARVRDASLLTVAGFFVAQATFAMRAQMLAVPLFAVALWVWSTRGTHPRRAWLIPLATVFVANLHGSVVLLPLVAGLIVVEDLIARSRGLRRDAGVFLVTLLATGLSPFGPGIWRYAIELSTDAIIREIIQEWAPVTTANLSGWLMMASVLPIIGLFARRRVPVPWSDLVWLGVFFLLAMTAIRGVLWWGLVAPVVVAGLIAAPDAEGRREPSTVARLMIAVLFGLVIVALPVWREDVALLDHAPAGVAAAVASLEDGAKVLAPQHWGSWLEIAVPGARPFVDSRIELFPREVWEDYSQVAFAGSRWRDTLKRWQPDVIVTKADWPIVPELRAEPGWRVLFEDDEAVVFVPD